MRLLPLFAVLVLIGCQSAVEEFELYEGEEGLAIGFSPSAPPEALREDQPMNVKVVLHNKGAHTVPYEDILVTFQSDPLYVKSNVGMITPADMDPAREELPGKSIAYPTGLDRIFSVPPGQFLTKKATGTLAKPVTEFGASVCYKYTTTLSESVCIDTAGFEGNERQQACEQEELPLEGGQGAPVSITEVEIESLPVVDPLIQGESIRPYFTLHIENVGEGRVVGPPEFGMEEACLLNRVPPDRTGAVQVEAWLLGAELECTPAEVQLFEGAGKTRCTVPQNDLSADVYNAKQNFQTVLTVNVSYIYTSSASREIELVRTTKAELPRAGEVTGYHYENGVPVSTKCEYYAQNPDRAPDFIRDRINANFSCSCSESQCRITRNELTCLPALCPGATYCCDR